MPPMSDAFTLWGRGLRLALRTAHIGLPATLLFSVIGGLGVEFVLGLLQDASSLDPASLELLWQGLLSFAGVLGAYMLVQVSKGRQTTAGSWLPVLLLAPSAFFGGAWWFVASAKGGAVGPGPMIFMIFAWTLLWSSFGGALWTIPVVRAAAAAREGRSLPVGQILSETATRFVPVAAAHGAYQHAYLIGMQILLPGIFAQVQLALVDHAAVLEPTANALSRSRALTSAVRGRVFRIFLMGWVLAGLLGMALVVPIAGWAPYAASWFDPSQPDFALRIGTGVVAGLVMWVQQLAYLEFYAERVAREAWRAAKRDEEREAARAAREGTAAP